jgi:hypothetical protein
MDKMQILISPHDELHMHACPSTLLHYLSFRCMHVPLFLHHLSFTCMPVPLLLHHLSFTCMPILLLLHRLSFTCVSIPMFLHLSFMATPWSSCIARLTVHSSKLSLVVMQPNPVVGLAGSTTAPVECDFYVLFGDCWQVWHLADTWKASW